MKTQALASTAVQGNAGADNIARNVNGKAPVQEPAGGSIESNGLTLQEIANQSPQARQYKAYSDMANDSDRVRHLRTVQQMADGHTLQAKENKTGLPDKLKSGIESISGYSMNDVNVHYNSGNPVQMQAHAYAQGADIHIAPGQEKHLAHEAWHVVQQKQGRVKPTLQMKTGVQMNDDEGLEKEADVMGQKALNTAPVENGQSHTLSDADNGEPGTVQRVKGGMEYTEHGGTELLQWQPSAIAGLVAHNVAPHTVNILGSPVTFYAVPNGTYADAARDNADHVAYQAPVIRLENDVESAEWIIERHTQEYTKDNFIARIGEDWIGLWNKREALRQAVAAEQAAHAGTQIVFQEGASGANLTQATAARVFSYRPQGATGSVQVTLGYKGNDAMANIALSNVSKYLPGVGDDNATRRERVGGTKLGTGILDKLATTNQWMNAKGLHTSLKADMTAVEAGVFSDIFSTDQLATVQLMVLMDTMARQATNDAGGGGQSTAKNIQQFFPKSARDTYVREMLGANVTAGRMGTIRVRLNAAIAASVVKFYAALDAIKLPVAAYREANPADAVSAGIQHNIVTTAGAVKAGHETTFKNLILGTQVNFTATAQDIIAAYTDASADSREQHRGDNLVNGFEYVVSGKAPHIVPRAGGAVFEERREVMVAGGNLGNWADDNPLRVAVVSLLRGTT